MKCPLCEALDSRDVGSDKRRQFFLCNSCGLIFVPNAFHPTPEQAKQRYDLHDNTESNQGYVRFLTQVAEIIDASVAPTARILDYGCGKGAILTALLQQRGKQCDPFDPLYDFQLPGKNIRKPYDAIVLCEVIEHCSDVRCTLREIGQLLDERGVVLVRTQCYPAIQNMARWWYAQDLTHVNFFSRCALETAAEILHRKLVDTSVRDIFLIR